MSRAEKVRHPLLKSLASSLQDGLHIGAFAGVLREMGVDVQAQIGKGSEALGADWARLGTAEHAEVVLLLAVVQPECEAVEGVVVMLGWISCQSEKMVPQPL